MHRCISRSKQVRVHRFIVRSMCTGEGAQVHRWEYTGEGTQLGE